MEIIFRKNFEVCILCKTYNHVLYIVDAMNGFCMQDTSFPYVCVIVDDASTDGEANIILEYIDKHFIKYNDLFCKTHTKDYEMLFAQHKENTNCYFAVYLLKYNHYKKKNKEQYYSKFIENSKFIAFCEGDDYWTDSQKLQIQVDALMKYSDCSFSSTGYKTIKEGEMDNNKTIFKDGVKICVYDIKDYGKLDINKTLTLLMRDVAYKECLNNISKYSNPKDAHLTYHLFKQGNCAYIPQCMGVYRDTGQGIWSSLPDAKKIEWDLCTLRELYNKNGKDPLLYERYFMHIIANISCKDIKNRKIKLFLEGLHVAKNTQDLKRLIKSFISYCKN